METTPEKTTPETSHTEVESYLSCERRHYYGYGLGLKAKTRSLSLERGIYGHEMLAEYYRTIKENPNVDSLSMKMKLQELIYSFETDYVDLYKELNEHMSDYVDYYLESDRELKILAIEEYFKIPVQGVNLKMVVDLVVQGWHGIEVWDHKFQFNFFSPTQIDLNPQLPKYVAALRAAGYRIDKARYNQIRYRNTKENKRNPRAKFKREEVSLPDARISRSLAEQQIAANEIRELKEAGLVEWNKRTKRTASEMVCQMCPFKTICGMELNGKDITAELEFSFDRKEDKK